MTKPIDINIVKGKTFKLIVQWETDPIVYKAITGITNTAPARLTVPSHGIPDGWKVAITNVKGMAEINAQANQIRDSDRRPVTVIDGNTIEINSIDAAGFHAYTSGGYVQYRTPTDLSVYTRARDTIKAAAGISGSNKLRCSVGGTTGTTKPAAAGVDGGVTWVATTNPATKEWAAGTAFSVNDVIDTKALLFCSSENGRIVLDNATRTITMLIKANDTAAIDWKRAVHELEMIKPGATFVDDEVVCLIPVSKVTVQEESTT